MIEAKGLCKLYGDITAVDDLSFQVAPGEVLGFLGPNGAGKSTTMRMIAGFLTPSSGTATVCGHDIQKEPIAAKTVIGYLPEGAPNYPEMSCGSFLEFIADIRQLKGDTRRARLDDVIERLHLGPVLHQAIDTLSKGFKRRVGLAQAILHDPQVLILDEPTDGLDPNQKFEVRNLISAMASDKIIVISTHILEEVHAVCSRAIVIAHGKLLADDSPQALEARSRYHNAVSMKIGDGTDADSVRNALRAVQQITRIEGEGNSITAFPKDGALLLPRITELANSHQWRLDELHLEGGRLDEVFRDITTAEGNA
ncbi:MAG: ATP-binding cassette domain-containing protein [Gammaproteobacteria bacterium]|nr:ATP-binding cassette domain-containing protein [Gammaproteobacteria bacterium]MDH3766882.1 ATP-binding cassette domain-containing protein [Gammaproteobacteria bacterium]